MDSEDSRDGSGDAQSSSSSSSSSSRSRRSSSSDRSDTEASKKEVKSHARSPSPHSNGPRSPSPQSNGPRSPSPESRSQSPSDPSKQPQSPDNLSRAHSDINSPENSMPPSPAGPKTPEGPKSPSESGSKSLDGPKSPSEVGSPVASSDHQYSAPDSPEKGPKTPGSPVSSVKSCSPNTRSRPASPDSVSQTSPQRSSEHLSRPASPSPDRNLYKQSPPKSPEKSPKEVWRRHTKAEQKMVAPPRERSRSESSQSSQSSSYNKRASNRDPATEEISDGEMESDQEDRKSGSKSVASDKQDSSNKDLNISHEDLSDVSDFESCGADDSQKQSKSKSPEKEIEEVNINGSDDVSSKSSPKDDKTETPKLDKVPQEKTSNTEDGEEQLDFEAEEGECVEPKSQEQTNGDTERKDAAAEDIKPGRRSRGSSLEEGEVSDEGERRPEESEPRPTCRFFSRGACTWGISCRFLHPGVTDKGNYNMFDVRGIPTNAPFISAPPSRDVPPPESAWERGLRTAKEMLRIANKRKEQDMDFEEKKLHLSVGGAVHDPDAELAYAAAAVGASPPHLEPHRDPEVYRGYGPAPPMYRGRYARPPAPVEERERFYERERLYEHERYERPPHYDERSAPTDDTSYHKRRVRSSREVIVQRAEVERREREPRERREREGRDGRERGGRGEEWADPWMRAEPAARRRRPPSSEESYSSSSSSNSSSRSSRSPGARRKKRATSRQRLSPSVIVRERRLATARATAMNPPAPRRRPPSPAAARQLAANPPAPHSHKDDVDPYGRSKGNRNRKRYSSSSGSGSESSSSSSESDSDSRSSSSGSSDAKRARHARLLNAHARPRLTKATGLAAAVSTAMGKKEPPPEKDQAKKRAATSPVDGGPNAKKSVSRREELLKQLKAVEDAIARKRSKI